MFDQRATFYFSEDQLLRLEVAMLTLRTTKRFRAGKSQIMRAALESFLGHSLEHQDRLVRELGGDPEAE